MKKTLLAVLLIFGVLFAINTTAEALSYPDSEYAPIGADEFPDPNIVEGSGMVSNTFNVTAGDTITFDFNLLTQERSEILEPGDEYVNDYFGAMLMNPLTDEIYETFRIADILTSTFSTITGGTTGPHGSTFSHQTGVISDFITVGSSYTGVSLAFGIFDVEDAEVDTGVIIDNISAPNGGFDSGLLGTGGYIYQHPDGHYMYGGNVHLLEVDDGSLSGVDTGGLSGNYAYMSTGPENMPSPPVVPEPISSALFLIGGATMGFRRFRKRVS